jgi:hypothetical protein
MNDIIFPSFDAKQMPSIQKGNLFLMLTAAIFGPSRKGGLLASGFIGKCVSIIKFFGTPSSSIYLDRNL